MAAPRIILPVFAFMMMFLAAHSFAETTCSTSGCDITITLKIAFSGANDSYINGAKNEIESFWNGPNGYQTVGDCQCTMRVKVETTKITNPAQVNCNPGPPGYHCVMVTDYNTNPPRNQSNITGAEYYAGYMYGIAKGNGNNSQTGWWSSIMSRPVDPNDSSKGNYKDIAHEAGHMMGLNHSKNTSSIMNNTQASGPSQEDLDGAAKAICGDDYCPDICCCGNGVVDGGRGEECDSMSSPSGCPSGSSCCPVCCSCYLPLCIAANGEYDSQASCQAKCGTGSSCYQNYKTGCWDCVRQNVVIEKTCMDKTNIRGNMGCDHPVMPFMGKGIGYFRGAMSVVPFMRSELANERINIITSEGDEGYIITEGGEVSGYGLEPLGDPSVTVWTDRETIEGMAAGELTPQGAIRTGKMRMEGNNFWNGLRFWMMEVFMGLGAYSDNQ